MQADTSRFDLGQVQIFQDGRYRQMSPSTYRLYLHDCLGGINWHQEDSECGSRCWGSYCLEAHIQISCRFIAFQQGQGTGICCSISKPTQWPLQHKKATPRSIQSTISCTAEYAELTYGLKHQLSNLTQQNWLCIPFCMQQSKWQRFVASSKAVSDPTCYAVCTCTSVEGPMHTYIHT